MSLSHVLAIRLTNSPPKGRAKKPVKPEASLLYASFEHYFRYAPDFFIALVRLGTGITGGWSARSLAAMGGAGSGNGRWLAIQSSRNLRPRASSGQTRIVVEMASWIVP